MNEKRITLAVLADIPETALRDQFNELVAENYGKSWDDYLREIEQDFLDYASGWWIRSEIAYGVKRSRAKAAA